MSSERLLADDSTAQPVVAQEHQNCHPGLRWELQHAKHMWRIGVSEEFLLWRTFWFLQQPGPVTRWCSGEAQSEVTCLLSGSRMRDSNPLPDSLLGQSVHGCLCGSSSWMMKMSELLTDPTIPITPVPSWDIYRSIHHQPCRTGNVCQCGEASAFVLGLPCLILKSIFLSFSIACSFSHH